MRSRRAWLMSKALTVARPTAVKPSISLIHEAVLASASRALEDCRCQFGRQAHLGCLPKTCNASARTSDSRK
jgi:hypothetical protein